MADGKDTQAVRRPTGGNHHRVQNYQKQKHPSLPGENRSTIKHGGGGLTKNGTPKVDHCGE